MSQTASGYNDFDPDRLTPYDVLGVREQDDQATVEQRWQILTAQSGPVQPPADVREAFAVLSDPDRRQAWHRERDLWNARTQEAPLAAPVITALAAAGKPRPPQGDPLLTATTKRPKVFTRTVVIVLTVFAVALVSGLALAILGPSLRSEPAATVSALQATETPAATDLSPAEKAAKLGLVPSSDNPCRSQQAAHWLKLTKPSAERWTDSIGHWTYTYGGVDGGGSEVLSYDGDSNTVSINGRFTTPIGMVAIDSAGAEHPYTFSKALPLAAPLTEPVTGAALTQVLYCAKA